jgi:hypothetical protein
MELLRRLYISIIFGFHRDHIQRVETMRLAPSDQVREKIPYWLAE